MTGLIQMMKQRHKVERENNIGEEVGWSKNVEVAKKNPKLAAMNKKFGMIHGLSSLANIMSFGSLAIHSWYLAGKLDLWFSFCLPFYWRWLSTLWIIIFRQDPCVLFICKLLVLLPSKRSLECLCNLWNVLSQHYTVLVYHMSCHGNIM